MARMWLSPSKIGLCQSQTCFALRATSHLSLLRFVFRGKCISQTLAESKSFIFRNGRQWQTRRRATEGRSLSVSPLHSLPRGHLYQEVATGPAALSGQSLPPTPQLLPDRPAAFPAASTPSSWDRATLPPWLLSTLSPPPPGGQQLPARALPHL